MAEDGIDNFALAKRKAARQLGALDTQSLPRNDEIEAELRAYRALYQAEEHPQLIGELRRIALEAMQALEQFNPYLTGPVLKGIAGPYAEIELQLFPDLFPRPQHPLHHSGRSPVFGRPPACGQPDLAKLARDTPATFGVRSPRRAFDPQDVPGRQGDRTGGNR
jgi:hypothetical protein